MQNEENQVLGMPDVTPDIKAPKDERVDKGEEEDLMKRMMYSPSASDADPTLEIKKSSEVEEKEEAKDLLKMLEKNPKKSEKYQKELLDKALKDPNSVQVQTPNGWMTVRSAIDQGFNMVTGQFDKEPIPEVDWDGEIAKLDPREQETIRRLMKRETGQANRRPLPGSEAAMQEQANPVLPQDQPLPETTVPGAEEGTPLALGGM